MIGSTPRRLLTIAAAGVAVIVIAVVALIAFHDDDDATATNCDTFRVTPALLWTGLKWALGIGLVGGLFPALRAARMEVTDALRAQ